MIARSIGWAVAATSFFAAIGIASTRPFGYDLVAYVDAAQRMLARQPLYPIALRESIYLGAGEFLYPPLAAVPFVPLALVPFELARAIWTVILLVVAAIVGFYLLRPVPPAVRPWAVAAYVLYLPLIAEITLGNLNLVTLALCLLAWHWRERAVLGGSTVAVAVGLKLLPVAIPFFFLAAGAGRMVLWAAGTGAGSIMLSWLWLAEDWRTYVGLVLELAGAPPAQAITLAPGVLGPARALLPMLALAVAVVAGRAFRRPERAPGAYAVALAAVPLSAPGIWYPYLVFALPLLANLLYRPTPWRLLGVLVAWLALEFPKRPGSPDIAFLGLVLLVALGIAMIVRPGTRDTAVEDPVATG